MANSIGGSDITALIPEEINSEILQSMEHQSAAAQLFTTTRMSTNQMRQPVLAMLPQAHFVASGGGLKQTTKLAWANKYLNAEEIAVIVPIPESYLDDVSYDVWGEVMPKIAEAFAILLDRAVFFGDAKPENWGKSILEHAEDAGNELVRGSVAFGSGVQDIAGDISAIMAMVENDGFDVNGHVARKTIRSAMRNLRATDGTPIYTNGVANSSPATIWGEPVRYIPGNGWINALADLMTGDFKQAILATRQDITYKILDQAVITDDEGNIIYNFAQQDMVGLRCVARYAYEVANAVNNDGDITDQSPFAVLRPVGYTP